MFNVEEFFKILTLFSTIVSSGKAYLSNDLVKSKDYELVMKLRVPSARNDLCSGEGAGGR